MAGQFFDTGSETAGTVTQCRETHIPQDRRLARREHCDVDARCNLGRRLYLRGLVGDAGLIVDGGLFLDGHVILGDADEGWH